MQNVRNVNRQCFCLVPVCAQSGSKSDRFIPNRNSIDADVSLSSLFESANSKAVNVTQSPAKQAHNRHLESLLLSASPSRSGAGRLLPCFESSATKPKALGILEVSFIFQSGVDAIPVGPHMHARIQFG